MSVAIIIPVYKERIDEKEELSVKQCFKILGKYKIIFLCPAKMKNGSFHSQYQNQSKFIFLDNKNFVSIQSYNHMLLSVWFYKLFINFKFILIYQLDAFVFEDKLHYWVKKDYSYIGAPWFNNKSDNSFMGVGNGGFSLRKVDDCISVLKSSKKVDSLKTHIEINKKSKKSFYLLRGIKHFVQSDSFQSIKNNTSINEDKIFSKAGNRFSFFKIPHPSLALSFAFEKKPRVLYKMNNNRLPFGCHAWWSYDLSFFQPFIKKDVDK